MAHDVSNVEYDLITVLQSKLEAYAAYDKYIKDCQQEGNDQCRQLFEQIRQDDENHTHQLRQQLQSLLGGAGTQAQTGATGTWSGSSRS
ncbi:MAG: hypothetical protein ACJ78Q_06730 [Chloroflexia bacterium]|jgi:bacterioferritin (cytochrome b1)